MSKDKTEQAKPSPKTEPKPKPEPSPIHEIMKTTGLSKLHAGSVYHKMDGDEKKLVSESKGKQAYDKYASRTAEASVETTEPKE